MDDNDLKKYIPHYGDRIAITSFCKRHLEEDGKARGDGSDDKVIDRLRNKIRARKRKHNQTPGSTARVRTTKSTRKINLGWKNFDFNDESYKQVRKVQGGSVRTPDVQRTDTKKELTRLGAQLFFRGGFSKKGRLDDFEIHIEDVEGRDIGDSSIGEIYEELQVARLSLYFCTKKKLNIEDVSSISLPKELFNSCLKIALGILLGNVHKYF